VSVGRLVEKKGFAYLLPAIALLNEKGYDVTCSIVGGGPLSFALESLAADLGLGEAVQFLGELPRPDTLRVVAAADIFCLPCCVADDGDRDSMPVAIKEAMALGRPIVSTTAVGVPELVSAGSGRLVSPRSALALAEGLALLIDDLEERSRMGRECILQIERFSLAKTVAALRELFLSGIRPVIWSE
jgi:glycosyltransferase involved in cell wall biosynthesis